MRKATGNHFISKHFLAYTAIQTKKSLNNIGTVSSDRELTHPHTQSSTKY